MDISLPNYVIDALNRLQHNKQKTQYSSHAHLPIIYDKSGQRQYKTSPDTSQFLTSQEITQVQSILGAFLYDARAIDEIMLTAINNISTQQAKPRKNTGVKIERLLNDTVTYPHIKIRFHASDMILQVNSDAADLVLPKERSRIAGYFRLDNKFKIHDNNIPMAQCSYNTRH